MTSRQFSDEVGLDVQRRDRNTVQVSPFRKRDALRQRSSPPPEAAPGPFEPVVVYLQAIDDEVEKRCFVFCAHGRWLTVTWYKAIATAVATFRESTRPVIGIVT